MPEIPPIPQTPRQNNQPNADGNATGFAPGTRPYTAPVKPARRPISLGYKLVLMGLITLGLMIPDLIIYYMSSDREDNQRYTVNSVSKSWSGAQLISGPIITIPYSYKHQNGEMVSGTVRLLPASLTANADIDSRVLTRGIYESTVYSGPVKLEGTFSLSELEPLGIPLHAYRMNESEVTVGIGDLKGLEYVSPLQIGKTELVLNGSNDKNIYENISHANHIFVASDTDNFTSPEGVRPVDSDPTNGCLQAKLNLVALGDSTLRSEFTFSLDVKLKGSQSLAFAPIGRENVITVEGKCKSPSFGGMFLPSERKVKGDDFSAVWNLNSNNRDYPQAFASNMAHEIAQSAVMVNMLVPVDRYQKVERTLKYAFLVIIFTFITMLFCEIVAKTPMYIFQYILTGLALMMFYSLLLSLVEHLSFGLSYLIAAVLTIGMVSIYVRASLRQTKMAVLTGGVLSIVYGFIYIVMCLETYALLTGSIGLFIALGVVMYASLKIKLPDNA